MSEDILLNENLKLLAERNNTWIGSFFVFALVVENSISQKYESLGGSAFGEIDRKEFAVWYLKNGACICYNADKQQSFELHGAIYQKWAAYGGINWGVPSTDETKTPDGVGRFNHFEKGQSIYWTPSTGAHVIYGAIKQRWASLGWERSYLGYPTSDEVDFPEGGRANTFQNGGIYWWPDTGAIDLKDVVIHYTGLHCFGETDYDQGSNSDEPYVVLSFSSPELTSTLNSRIYEDVDSGETFPDLVEIYRGKPYGINLNAVVMEHDEGDPNIYRDKIRQVFLGAHAAGTVALGLIPVVGPIIAAVAGPSLGALMPDIADKFNELLGLGDDIIGTSTIVLSSKQMVLLSAKTQDSSFNGIGYKLESSLISGSGASYKVYFGIVPA